MDFKGYITSLEEYIFVLEDVITKLEKIRTEVRSWHIGCMAGKTTGVAIGGAGMITSIIGIIAAPFTGGISLAATWAGLSTGILGTATNTASEITASVSDK